MDGDMELLDPAGLPERFADTEALEEFMSRPTRALIDDLARLDGDIMVLGVGGKMGPTLARLAMSTAAALAQFEAEQDRVKADKSTNWQLLQVEDELAQARSEELFALVAWHAARVVLERATGTYLEWRGILIPAAQPGGARPASDDADK